jgi:hypothetical protein
MNSGHCTRSGASHKMRPDPGIVITASEELPPPYSITSSAREISAWGTVTPRASRGGCRCNLSLENLSLESRRDGRANGVVNSRQPIADEHHPSDADHRNQRGYQAILDGRCTGLVLEKTRAKVIFHRGSSRARAEMRNHGHTMRGVSRRALASPCLVTRRHSKDSNGNSLRSSLPFSTVRKRSVT